MNPNPRLNHVLCVDTPSVTRMALHRMAYWEWGDAANPHVIVCVHGLTRQGRDFDTLARALAPYCRVVCPDVSGAAALAGSRTRRATNCRNTSATW